MLDRALIKKEYSALDDVIYLDTSKVSMPPLRVREAWKKYIEGYANVYCLNYETYYPEKLEKAKNELAKLLRVDSEEIAFTHSVSDSMTILANSFPFQAGDNVVITNEEHASNVIPWLGLKRLGVNVKFAPSKGGFVEADDILELVDARTRIVSTATVFFCSGYAMDVKKIGEACKKRGIVYAVDGTQSIGLLELRPQEWGIDYAAGGGHKGLLGTKSVGYAYCSRALLKQLKPYTGSLQSAGNTGRPCRLKDYDEIEWFENATCLESGNYPFGDIEALGNGVSLINELGIENIEAEIRIMEALLREKIKNLPLRILTPPEKNQSGMLIIYFPEKAEPERVKEIIWKNKIRATVRYDYIRMTLDFYNSPEQMDRIADTLREISTL